jgi:cyclomaltodextrinase / maltogenic alpha-amylase / neopullulanase
MPLLYTGQEIGLDRRLEFFEKDPVEWKDTPLKEKYSTMFNLKQNNPVLFNGERGGAFVPVKDADMKKMFSFIRHGEEDKIFALFNFSGEENEITLSHELLQGKYNDLFSGRTVELKNTYRFKLKPWEYLILVQQ